MKKAPLWFTIFVGLALLWNLAGLLAVIADLRLTESDIAAMPARQQALYAARPIWSVVASVLAVLGGTVGCMGLMLRARWSAFLLYASLLGVVFQDLGIFLIADANMSDYPAAYALQGFVFLIAVGLIALAKFAASKSWLR